MSAIDGIKKAVNAALHVAVDQEDRAVVSALMDVMGILNNISPTAFELSAYERTLVQKSLQSVSGTGYIDAIKSYRTRTNKSLRESKEAVDAFRATLNR